MNKLIQVYQTLAPSGFIKAPEIATEIMKKAGFVPSRFIVETDQLKPDGIGKIDNSIGASDILKQVSNSQPNSGNGGE